ncbi:hypothetical protein ACFLU5_14155 [Bacteroidota bacterium]
MKTKKEERSKKNDGQMAIIGERSRIIGLVFRKEECLKWNLFEVLKFDLH